MIDMKVTPKPQETKATMLAECVQTEHDKPTYPWGLEIRLRGPELEKLGIPLDRLPQVGALMNLAALARVQGVSSEQMQDGKPEVCVTLQIEQMQLGSLEASLADRMYGGA